MSSDYSVVVRGKKRSPTQLRTLVAGIAKLAEPDEHDEAAGDDCEELRVADLGTIEIRRLARGYQVSIDGSRDGNRERFEELGAVVDAIAAKLGTVVDGDVAAALVLEETRHASPDARIAELALEDAAGGRLEATRIGLDHFVQMLDPANHPSRVKHFERPNMFDEDHRYGLRAARMVAVVHDDRGRPFRRFVWQLDGYGRIREVVVTDD